MMTERVRGVTDLFSLNICISSSKFGLVSNFGKWENDRWKCEVELRRRVFDWEVGLWEDFRGVIIRIALVEGTRDRVVWTPLSSGRFTCSSFRKYIIRVGEASNMWNLLWKLPVPLKVKCFGWLLMRERVVVRDLLQVLGFSLMKAMSAPFVARAIRITDICFFTTIKSIECGLRLHRCGDCIL